VRVIDELANSIPKRVCFSGQRLEVRDYVHFSYLAFNANGVDEGAQRK
jgi:hypothetical protein